MNNKFFALSPAVVAFFGAASISSLLSYQILTDLMERSPLVIFLQWVALGMVLVLFSGYALLASPPLRGWYVKAVALGGLLGILASTQFPSKEFAANFALFSIGIATIYTMVIMGIGLKRLKNIKK